MPRSDNNTTTRKSARNQPRNQSKKMVYEEIEVPKEEVNEVVKPKSKVSSLVSKVWT